MLQDPSAKAEFSIPVNVNGLGLDHPYLRNYDNFFKCIYNIDPVLNTHTHISLVGDCVSLLQAAEAIDSTPCVRRYIESALLRLGHSLYVTIRGGIEGWADLGIRIQSPAIFREAMVHIIGGWSDPTKVDVGKLEKLEHGETIKNIALAKLGVMVSKMKRIDQELLVHYPTAMLHAANGTVKPGRAIYAGDIYMWQSLMLVRQYVTNAILDYETWGAADGGYKFYRSIYVGNDQYLNRQDIDGFLKSFPMTTKGRECLEVGLLYVKEQMKPLVSDLFACHAQGSTTPDDFGYFVCASFADNELPWVDKREDLSSMFDTETSSELESMDEDMSTE